MDTSIKGKTLLDLGRFETLSLENPWDGIIRSHPKNPVTTRGPNRLGVGADDNLCWLLHSNSAPGHKQKNTNTFWNLMLRGTILKALFVSLAAPARGSS